MQHADHMPSMFRRLWSKLNQGQRLQIGMLLVVLVLSTLAEIITISSILPFIALLTQPDLVMDMPVIGPLVGRFDIADPADLRGPLAGVFIVAALVSGGLRGVYLTASLKVAHAVGRDLAEQAFWRNLHQEYAEHVRHNSQEVQTALNIKINAIVQSCLTPLFQVIGAGVLSVVIVLTLFLVDPAVTFSLLVVVGLAMLLIYIISRRILDGAGAVIARDQPLMLGLVQTTQQSIRDIHLDGLQPFFARQFSHLQRTIRVAHTNIGLVLGLPRFVIETLFLVLVAVLVLVLTSGGQDLVALLPVLSVFAIGAQRLLPVAQQVFQGVGQIRAGAASVHDALDMLDVVLPDDLDLPEGARTRLDQALHLEDVWFCYAGGSEGAENWALRGITLSIARGERIGILGQTGSGKSTLVDLIMGLLVPTKGTIRADDTLLRGVDRRLWWREVAHVPQTIYLSDTSVGENIALGQAREAVDMAHLRHVSEQADVASFISDGEDGFATRVGENGGQLSGGQRQRIGIARALYKGADLLVLDEATSALDTATETCVMEAINDMGRDITIIMVAHRLATLAHCDRILDIRDGQIARICTYQDLEEGRV